MSKYALTFWQLQGGAKFNRRCRSVFTSRFEMWLGAILDITTDVYIQKCKNHGHISVLIDFKMADLLVFRSKT